MATVTLYMAISADGFIATSDDNTEWVGDESWQSYLEFVANCDVVLVGKNTFQLMEKDEFVEGTKYLVVASDSTRTNHDSISITSKNDLPQVEKIGVIGGGELNGRLLALGVINEVILDVEPIILGSGKKLFGERNITAHLKLLNSKQISPSTIQNRYKVERA